MSDEGPRTLMEMAARMREAPDALKRAMPLIGEATKQYLRECYARGVTPDGEPWPPTEEGARAAIEGHSLQVMVSGNRLQVRLSLHEALHSKGQARGGKRRRLVPVGAVPPELLKRWHAIVQAELIEVLT